MIVALGGATGALVGGYLVAEFGFETLFVLMSVIAIAASVVVLLTPRETL